MGEEDHPLLAFPQADVHPQMTQGALFSRQLDLELNLLDTCIQESTRTKPSGK